MNIIKKLVVTCLVVLLSACSTSSEEGTKSAEFTIPDAEYSTEVINLPQFDDEKIINVVLYTSMGDIQLELFPDVAPKAVENFLTHAKDGYYDGLTFHRVMNDFMIQGGDPLGTGTGGESIWQTPFEDEFDLSLRNFNGALAMANSGADTNGSQFFIVQNNSPISDADIEGIYTSAYSAFLIDAALKRVEEKQQELSAEDFELYFEAEEEKLSADMEKGVPQDFKDAMEPIIEQYQSVGGTPWLDDVHTVFGQVVEGMDVVNAIAATPVDANSKPITPVIIETIEVIE